MILLPMTIEICVLAIDPAAKRFVSVRHTLHDVVTISDEADADGEGNDSDLPERHFLLLLRWPGLGPCDVHASPDTDSITDIVGTVGERGGAGSDDLDERVQVLDLVGVLGGVGVDAFHTATLGSAHDSDLSLVNIVVKTVQKGDDRVGREAPDDGLDIVLLIDGTGTKRVLVESTHGPAERTTGLAERGVVTLSSISEHLLITDVRDLILDLGGFCRENGILGRLLLAGLTVDGLLLGGAGSAAPADTAFFVLVMLNNSVVGDSGELSIGRSFTRPEERPINDLPDSESVVLSNDLGVDEGDEEKCS